MTEKEKVTTIQELIQKMEYLKMPTCMCINLWLGWLIDNKCSEDEVYGNIFGFIWGLFATGFITEYERNCLVDNLINDVLGEKKTMKKLQIQGNEYIEFSLCVPVLLNTTHYESFKESFERYKKSYENEGEVYNGTLDDYANLCAASAMNIGLLKYADIISR